MKHIRTDRGQRSILRYLSVKKGPSEVAGNAESAGNIGSLDDHGVQEGQNQRKRSLHHCLSSSIETRAREELCQAHKKNFVKPIKTEEEKAVKKRGETRTRDGSFCQEDAVKGRDCIEKVCQRAQPQSRDRPNEGVTHEIKSEATVHEVFQEKAKEEGAEDIEEVDTAATAVNDAGNDDDDEPSVVEAKPQVVALPTAEAERMERIRRNMEKMRSLGLGLGGAAMLALKESNNKGPKSKERKRSLQMTSLMEPRRRSTRLMRSQATEKADSLEDQQYDPLKENKTSEISEKMEYMDSSVLRYACRNAQEIQCFQGNSSVTSSKSRISGFRRLPGTFIDQCLSKAYSMDWRPGLTIAGGKDGYACVWGSASTDRCCVGESMDSKRKSGDMIDAINNQQSNESLDCEIESFMSYKLHKGWIADVQFLCVSQHANTNCNISSSPQEITTQDLRFLTAGNDGWLSLWNAGKSAIGIGGREKPRCIAQDTPHGGAGIFSMSEIGGLILTSSKDFSAAVTDIDPAGGFQVLQHFEDLHNGVVKCARWKPVVRHSDDGEASYCQKPFIFASCGNDRSIRITDIRQQTSSASSTAAMAIKETHSTAINCVAWSPSNEYVLLSSSHDPHILLHDIRRTTQPLVKMSGHASPNRRVGSILHPAFVESGSAVVTPGDRSTVLTLYCADSGGIISQGDTAMLIGAIFSRGRRGDPLFCATNRSAMCFAPLYNAPCGNGTYC